MRATLDAMYYLGSGCINIATTSASAFGKFLFFISAATMVATENRVLIPGKGGKISDFIKQDLTDDTLVLDGQPHYFNSAEPIATLGSASFAKLTEQQFLQNAIELSQLETSTIETINGVTVFTSSFMPPNPKESEGPITTHTGVLDPKFDKEGNLIDGTVYIAEYHQQAKFTDGVMTTTCFFKPKDPDKRQDCQVKTGPAPTPKSEL